MGHFTRIVRVFKKNFIEKNIKKLMKKTSFMNNISIMDNIDK